MEHFAGLDVSVNETSVCIVDDTGRIVREVKVEGLGADSEEKREPASDIDTILVDSLKALDPNRPIREADIPIHRNKSRSALINLGDNRALPYNGSAAATLSAASMIGSS